MLYLHYYKYFLHVKECICLLIGIIPIKGILKEKKIKKNKQTWYLPALCKGSAQSSPDSLLLGFPASTPGSSPIASCLLWGPSCRLAPEPQSVCPLVYRAQLSPAPSLSPHWRTGYDWQDWLQKVFYLKEEVNPDEFFFLSSSLQSKGIMC